MSPGEVPGTMVTGEAGAAKLSAPDVQPAKVDPETLVLRGSPRRAVRFRREVVIALAAATSLGVAAAAWVALQPASFRMIAVGDDEPRRRADAAAETLSAAPGSYDAVPALGPPLPGDLGRPILAHQKSLAASPMDDPGAGDAAELLRQKKEAEAAAARALGVMMAVGGGAGIAASVQSGMAPGSVAAAPQTATEPQASGLGGPAAGRGDSDVNPHPLMPPTSP
jgi:type IV secretory pathway VirB10-like protein